MTSGNIFSAFPTLFCVPNIFGGINRQFVTFAKFIQSVFCISFARHILKVFSVIVVLVSVFVVYMALRWTMPYKSGRNHRVNSFVKMLAIYRKRNKQISIIATSRLQNLIGCWLISRATKNFAYYRLTNVYKWRNFSSAISFLAHAMNQHYLFIRKRSLTQINGAKAFYATHIANFVAIFKAMHGSPKFHMNTPNS